MGRAPPTVRVDGARSVMLSDQFTLIHMTPFLLVLMTRIVVPVRGTSTLYQPGW